MTNNKLIPEDTGNGRELFLESFSGRYFLSSKEAVLKAEEKLNQQFAIKGIATLNEFYFLLGISPTELGEEIGWDSYPDLELGKQWIEFDHILTDIGVTNIYFGRGFEIRYKIPPELVC